MKDFKLEVGMFVRDITNEISVITKVDKNRIDFYNFDNNIQTYTYKLDGLQYEVSYTYDFKEIIYSNIKKELLTEEEKEIVRKWVDVVGKDRINTILFSDDEDTYMIFYCTNKDMFSTIDYKDKFKNVELDKEYTLEELGL